MKKIISLLLASAILLSLAACGNGTQAVTDPAPQETKDSPAPEENGEGTEGGAPSEGNGILIAYFSYGENAPLPEGADASSSASIQVRGGSLTGNTGLVAGMIADATGGELFSILTAEQYPDKYDDTIEVGQAEQAANAHPELAAHIESPEAYSTIFLGYPNWWGDMPMAVYSFLDEYDFSGKTIVPFVTSGGSGFSDTIRAIEEAEPDSTILEGISISYRHAAEAGNDISEWLAGLGFAE